MGKGKRRVKCEFNPNLYCPHVEEKRTLQFCLVCQLSYITSRLDQIKNLLRFFRVIGVSKDAEIQGDISERE